jgi:hypothetical protein
MPQINKFGFSLGNGKKIETKNKNVIHMDLWKYGQI